MRRALRIAALALCCVYGFATSAIPQGIGGKAGIGGKGGIGDGVCAATSNPSGAHVTDLTASNLTPSNTTRTLNIAASPACTTSGAIFTEDSTVNEHQATELFTGTISNATPLTMTLYISSYAYGRYAGVALFNSSFTNYVAIEAVDPKSCSSSQGVVVNGWSAPNVTYSLVNGYCEVTLTATSVAETALYANFNLTVSSTGSPSTYPGNGQAAVAVWGLTF